MTKQCPLKAAIRGKTGPSGGLRARAELKSLSVVFGACLVVFVTAIGLHL